MKVTVLALLLVVTILGKRDPPVPPAPTPNDGPDYSHIDPPTKIWTEWILAGMQGFWLGYERGFLSNKKIELNPKCLNANAESTIYNILLWLYDGQMQDVFSVVEDGVNLAYNNYMFCGLEETVKDIKEFCSQPKTCEIAAFSTNIADSYVGILTNLEGVFAWVFEETEQEPADFFLQMMHSGLYLGSIVRLVWGYNW